MERSFPKANTKSLVLYCIPFIKKGVGSAWGLPVIARGKERLSALSLSENLKAPGAVSFGADPFKAERLLELEDLGIGPLGRYIGGEPVKPFRLEPEDFFSPANRTAASAAGLFCNALEFKDTHWVLSGTPAALFHSHLEFLRTWGFSGGVSIDEKAIAPLLAEYVLFLQKETAQENPKIIVLVSAHFFETRLNAQLPNAKVLADTSKGEIPVNYSSGGIPVLKDDAAGLCIVLYEDLTPMLRVQKARCDILVTVNAEPEKERRSASLYAREITARVKLTVSTDRTAKKKNNKPGKKNELPLNAYLFRNCEAELLPFPAHKKTGSGIALDWKAEQNNWAVLKQIYFSAVQSIHQSHFQNSEVLKKTHYTEILLSGEEAAVLQLLPQWEAGRIEGVFGSLFAVNSRFSGLRAANFKEEQALFQKESTRQKGENWEAPPIRQRTAFSALNETQFDFFVRWRSECRRGNIRITPSSMYMETYIWLYAEELALCMGKEGPLQHFTALMQLFHACREHYTETAKLLCKYCVDFAVVYGICKEAFPILLNELFNTGWFDNLSETNETEDMLLDLAICHFCIIKKLPSKTAESWPLIKGLIPSKIINRKENDTELSFLFCRALAALDDQLRKDWDRGFFTFFFPPLLLKVECKAFENSFSIGESSYTVYRPGFSSHKPLLNILSALALEPEKNPLSGVRIRPHPLNLENELLEELRRESDAVREILKTAESIQAEKNRSPFRNYPKRHALPEAEQPAGTVNKPVTAYIPLDKAALGEFFASLKENERAAVQNLIEKKDLFSNNQSASETLIDTINFAFYDQFGDLLIETGPKGPSINAEYEAILETWE